MGHPNSSTLQNECESDPEAVVVKLNLTTMSRSTLAEIGQQMCLTCNQRYGSEKPPGALPCGHHFCTPCIGAELERQREDAKKEAETGAAERVSEFATHDTLTTTHYGHSNRGGKDRSASRSKMTSNFNSAAKRPTPLESR